MLPKSRTEALAIGSNKFDTGKICSNGHLSYRYTTSGTCAECINGTIGVSLSTVTKLKVKSQSLKLRADSLLKQSDLLMQQALDMEKEYIERDAFKSKKALSVDETKARNEALDSLAVININVDKNDVDLVKSVLSAYLIQGGYSLTVDDVWAIGKVRHGVVYKVRCPPQYVNEFIGMVNKTYSRAFSAHAKLRAVEIPQSDIVDPALFDFTKPL